MNAFPSTPSAPSAVTTKGVNELIYILYTQCIKVGALILTEGIRGPPNSCICHCTEMLTEVRVSLQCNDCIVSSLNSTYIDTNFLFDNHFRLCKTKNEVQLYKEINALMKLIWLVIICK